jgi:hypothetical protein
LGWLDSCDEHRNEEIEQAARGWHTSRISVASQ